MTETSRYEDLGDAAVLVDGTGKQRRTLIAAVVCRTIGRQYVGSPSTLVGSSFLPLWPS